MEQTPPPTSPPVREVALGGQQALTERTFTGFDDPVYSNFDHVFDEAVAQRLEADESLYAQHASLSFCGYVYHTSEGWQEDVWRYGRNTVSFQCDDLPTMVAHVVATFGSE